MANLRLNTLFDGLFHAATWVATAIGIWLLHRRVRAGTPWSGRVLLGGALMGWGGFNVVEGVIDHHVLGLHHVREAGANPLVWDLAVLGFGVQLLLGGWSLTRAARRRAKAAPRVRRAA